MNSCLKCALTVAVGLVSAIATAQPPIDKGPEPTQITAPVVRAPGVTIEASRRMRARGFQWDHEIRVALPPSYFKTHKSYPVLWVTDGSLFFDEAVSIAAQYLELEVIVVGVGAPTEVPYDEFARRRIYDFTPTNKGPSFDGLGSEAAQQWERDSKEKLGKQATGLQFVFGGGPEFLHFLVNEVRPTLAKEYRMSNEHILFGDSGGGIFCTYALLDDPTSFTGYICGSPALNWGNRELFSKEEQYAKTHKDLQTRVFFGIGESELLQNQPLRIASSTALMVEILRARNYPSLKLYARVFPGETHGSVGPLNLSWGLRTVLQDSRENEASKN